jgi:hypothetical protein
MHNLSIIVLYICLLELKKDSESILDFIIGWVTVFKVIRVFNQVICVYLYIYRVSPEKVLRFDS